MFAEHQRQRQAVDLLLRVAGGEFDAAGFRRLIRFLTKDLIQHIEDEDAELFPLLRAHCRADDDIESMLARLSAEHDEGRPLALAVAEDLERALGGNPLTDPARRKIKSFAAAIRRHLAFENAALLPLAEVRLTARVVAPWARRLSERR